MLSRLPGLCSPTGLRGPRADRGRQRPPRTLRHPRDPAAARVPAGPQSAGQAAGGDIDSARSSWPRTEHRDRRGTLQDATGRATLYYTAGRTSPHGRTALSVSSPSSPAKATYHYRITCPREGRRAHACPAPRPRRGSRGGPTARALRRAAAPVRSMPPGASTATSCARVRGAVPAPAAPPGPESRRCAAPYLTPRPPQSCLQRPPPRRNLTVPTADRRPPSPSRRSLISVQRPPLAHRPCRAARRVAPRCGARFGAPPRSAAALPAVCLTFARLARAEVESKTARPGQRTPSSRFTTTSHARCVAGRQIELSAAPAAASSSGASPNLSGQGRRDRGQKRLRALTAASPRRMRCRILHGAARALRIDTRRSRHLRTSDGAVHVRITDAPGSPAGPCGLSQPRPRAAAGRAPAPRASPPRPRPEAGTSTGDFLRDTSRRGRGATDSGAAVRRGPAAAPARARGAAAAPPARPRRSSETLPGPRAAASALRTDRRRPDRPPQSAKARRTSEGRPHGSMRRVRLSAARHAAAPDAAVGPGWRPLRAPRDADRAPDPSCCRERRLRLLRRGPDASQMRVRCTVMTGRP